MTFYELTYEELGVKTENVYEFMGVNEDAADEAFKTEFDQIIGDVSTWLRPRICYTVVTPEQVEAVGFSMGNIVTHQLKGAKAYAFFVCTAGMEYQQYQDKLMADGDMVRVFIADALGSTLAECCADRMEERLQANIDKLGWKRTNRYSPGYCGWHVREQQRLFPFFPPQPCGVNLTDSSLMIPIKSVSGIIGLGPEVKYHPYTCGLCNYAKCYKRKKKKDAR